MSRGTRIVVPLALLAIPDAPPGCFAHRARPAPVPKRVWAAAQRYSEAEHDKQESQRSRRRQLRFRQSRFIGATHKSGCWDHDQRPTYGRSTTSKNRRGAGGDNCDSGKAVSSAQRKKSSPGAGRKAGIYDRNSEYYIKSLHPLRANATAYERSEVFYP